MPAGAPSVLAHAPNGMPRAYRALFPEATGEDVEEAVKNRRGREEKVKE